MSSVYSLPAIQVAIFAMWLMGNQMLCSLVSLDIFIYSKEDIPCVNSSIVANETFMSRNAHFRMEI